MSGSGFSGVAIAAGFESTISLLFSIATSSVFSFCDKSRFFAGIGESGRFIFRLFKFPQILIVAWLPSYSYEEFPV